MVKSALLAQQAVILLWVEMVLVEVLMEPDFPEDGLLQTHQEVAADQLLQINPGGLYKDVILIQLKFFNFR